MSAPLCLRRAVVTLSLLMTVAACGPSIVTCPGSDKVRCLTTPVCTYDKDRGCQVCRCAPPAYVRPEQIEPVSPSQ